MLKRGPIRRIEHFLASLLDDLRDDDNSPAVVLTSFVISQIPVSQSSFLRNSVATLILIYMIFLFFFIFYLILRLAVMYIRVHARVNRKIFSR